MEFALSRPRQGICFLADSELDLVDLSHFDEVVLNASIGASFCGLFDLFGASWIYLKAFQALRRLLPIRKLKNIHTVAAECSFWFLGRGCSLWADCF
jgi:hypothetical protein